MWGSIRMEEWKNGMSYILFSKKLYRAMRLTVWFDYVYILYNILEPRTALLWLFLHLAFPESCGEPAKHKEKKIMDLYIWQLHICTFGHLYTFLRRKQPPLIRCLDTEDKHIFSLWWKAFDWAECTDILLCQNWMWFPKAQYVLDITWAIHINLYIMYKNRSISGHAEHNYCTLL